MCKKRKEEMAIFSHQLKCLSQLCPSPLSLSPLPCQGKGGYFDPGTLSETERQTVSFGGTVRVDVVKGRSKCMTVGYCYVIYSLFPIFGRGVFIFPRCSSHGWGEMPNNSW